MRSHNCPTAEKSHFPQSLGYSQVSGWPSVCTEDSCSEKGFLVSQLEPCNCCLGLFHSRCKSLHLLLLNFMTFQSVLLYGFARSFYIAALSSTSTISSYLVLSAKLLRGHSVLLSRLLH